MKKFAAGYFFIVIVFLPFFITVTGRHRIVNFFRRKFILNFYAYFLIEIKGAKAALDGGEALSGFIFCYKAPLYIVEEFARSISDSYNRKHFL